MKKVCELCKSTARIYCDSDQASLCWDCDAVVHSANFIVARHCRSLLCHVCQSPTPWNASGDKLGRTISVCERCVDSSGVRDEGQGGSSDEIGTDDDFEDDDGDSSDEMDEYGNNQVVPWSPGSPPPAATSSSSCNESSSRFCNRDRDLSSKRFRENARDLSYEDDPDSTSSRMTPLTCATPAAADSTGSSEATFVDSLASRPLKSRRTEAKQSARIHNGPAGSRSESIVGSSKRTNHQKSRNKICK